MTHPSEAFQPPRHRPPTTLLTRLLFQLRLLTDFQVRTVERAVRTFLQNSTGTVADIGCGMSPYRHLFDRFHVSYLGVDTVDAGDFQYHNSSVVSFDGKHLPFADNFLEGFICTEVVEHLEDPAAFIMEIHRVLKPGGRGLFTIPWSARFHYIPFDYGRYTPTRLSQFCQAFATVEVQPRGTDLTVIAAKLIVLFIRQVQSLWKGKLLSLFGLLLLLPVLPFALLFGHLSLLLHLGSTDDPLGYTVLVSKSA